MRLPAGRQGFRNAEFKTKNSIECYHKADTSKFKSQTKTATPDWPATFAAERTTEEEIYLSGKHNFLGCSHFSARCWIVNIDNRTNLFGDSF